MSHYETPEQRQIRELRDRISSVSNYAYDQEAQNSKLRREMDTVRSQQRKENEKLLRQLKKQEASARKDKERMNETIQALDDEIRERERLQEKRIQAMQHQQEEQVRRLETEFRMEQEGLRDEIRQTRSEMRRGLDQLRLETDQKLQKQREENQRNLNQLGAKLDREISAVDKKVNSLAQQIAAKEQGDRELAEYWAQESTRLINQIRESFREQLFDQRRISILERKIRQAYDDINGGQYQSAITSGRDAFFDALDMKEDLAAAELEWNYWFNVVKSREGQLLQDLESAENRVYEIDTDEGTITYSNGIDYWTFGQLTILKKQITEIRNSFQNIDAMTTNQLQQAEEQLRAQQEQLALIENAAHINVAMSVSRYETAVKIGGILDSNYKMIDAEGEFFGREDREEYHAIFQNPNTGDQVAVVITPIPDDAGVVTNHIELLVGNADNNPVTRDRIAHEVAEKLRISGVEGCAFPCARRFGDDTIQEVNRVGDIEAVERGSEKARASLPGRNEKSDTSMSRVRRRTQIN